MARHALVDLAQIFRLDPVHDAADRLPAERYQQLYDLLRDSGVKVCLDDHSYERLRDMRMLYEGYAEALGEYLRMPLPPWIAERPHKDNWLAVAKLRAKTEAANPPLGEARTMDEVSQTIARLVDDHHEF